MKLDLKGLKFNIWLTIVLLSTGILLIMGVLQFSLIRPYYRNNKIQSVKEISDALENYILDDGKTSSFEKAFKLTVDNNVCAIIFNESGQKIYSADNLGSGCAFNQAISLENQESFIPDNDGSQLNELLDANEGDVSITLSNTKTNQEMVIYGKKIQKNLGNYYLFVNSPLEPVDSLISFFLQQYWYYTIIVIIFSFLLAIIVSGKIANPIIEMKQEADILATGNYDVNFKHSYFTETNELSKTLNDATHKLGEVDELRRDLIANVSHDIKTPLTMIKAYAEMIMDISGDNPVKREEHLNVIISEVNYLDKLVTDMSELSKLQSGNYVLNYSNFDIAETFNEVIDLNRVLIEQYHLNIILEMEDSIIVYGDEFKLTQVLNNFLSNAIKHSSDGKKIIMRCKKFDECVRVEIQDEGEGIAAKDLPYIWDRYYKIDKSFRRNQQSTGLGLAIVKAILDAHGAKYGVTSEEGKGSCFYFELSQENVF